MRRKNMKNRGFIPLKCRCKLHDRTRHRSCPWVWHRYTESRLAYPVNHVWIFFEDINFGADGGLYAELIKNRSFEFESPWGGWEPFGDVSIAEKNPCFNKNPHYAHLTYTGQITGTGLENEGFKGIGIKADENYDFSLYARTETNNPIKLRIELVNRDNDILWDTTPRDKRKRLEEIFRYLVSQSYRG